MEAGARIHLARARALLEWLPMLRPRPRFQPVRPPRCLCLCLPTLQPKEACRELAHTIGSIVSAHRRWPAGPLAAAAASVRACGEMRRAHELLIGARAVARGGATKWTPAFERVRRSVAKFSNWKIEFISMVQCSLARAPPLSALAHVFVRPLSLSLANHLSFAAKLAPIFMQSRGTHTHKHTPTHVHKHKRAQPRSGACGAGACGPLYVCVCGHFPLAGPAEAAPWPAPVARAGPWIFCSAPAAPPEPSS